MISTRDSVVHVASVRLCYLAEMLWPAILISVAARSHVPHISLTTKQNGQNECGKSPLCPGELSVLWCR